MMHGFPDWKFKGKKEVFLNLFWVLIFILISKAWQSLHFLFGKSPSLLPLRSPLPPGSAHNPEVQKGDGAVSQGRTLELNLYLNPA